MDLYDTLLQIYRPPMHFTHYSICNVDKKPSVSVTWSSEFFLRSRNRLKWYVQWLQYYDFLTWLHRENCIRTWGWFWRELQHSRATSGNSTTDSDRSRTNRYMGMKMDGWDHLQCNCATAYRRWWSVFWMGILLYSNWVFHLLTTHEFYRHGYTVQIICTPRRKRIRH